MYLRPLHVVTSAGLISAVLLIVAAAQARTTGVPAVSPVVFAAATSGNLDSDLADVLFAAGFTGNIQNTFQQRIQANLGRPINPRLVDLGRLLWFD